LRYGLSYRDVEELLAERGTEVGHVTVYRWVQRFTPLLADVARFARQAPGDRWFVDETYVKVNGIWGYVYRDPAGDPDRDGRRRRAGLSRCARRSGAGGAASRRAVRRQNPIEADRGELKRRLRPMRGLQTDRSAQVVITGHYELAIEARSALRVAAAFTEPAQAI
jgi:transposase-like protein